MTADDPTRVRVAASDATSGLSSESLEINLDGTSTWTEIPVTPDSSGFSAALDDGALAQGLYHLRARVVDAAGNDRTIDTLRRRRSRAALALPIRLEDAARRRTRPPRPRSHRPQRKAKVSTGARRQAALPVRANRSPQRPTDYARSEPGRGRAGRGLAAGRGAGRRVDADRDGPDLAHGPVLVQGAEGPQPARAIPLHRHRDRPIPHLHRRDAC